MDLAARTRLGPYEILSAIGAGGMGEVYRARDTRLDRCVAIKILPAHFSSNPELKGRFEREARTLSSVAHPHICHLYDVGSQSGVEFLVMELLEGETLAERLKKGPLPLHEVLQIGIEIADALTKAHRVGLVHRDLKPSNIMLTKNGAKLMDFGLAKPAALDPLTGSSGTPPMGGSTTILESPRSPVTTVGAVVGTIQYISPEQIEGKEADARSDIFAFGAVLYEMATGQRAFDGKSRVAIASAILEKEPTPITSIQAGVPPSLAQLICTCLAKDPDERFQTAHDVKLQLRWLLQSGTTESAPRGAQPRTRLWRLAVGLLAAVVFALLLQLAKLSGRPAGSAPGVTRFSLALPAKQELAVDLTLAIALSPDGKRLAYVASDSGVSHLYVHRLDQFDSIAVPDSEGATFPFFSPSSDWVAYFSEGKLKKAPVDGGLPVVVCEVPTFFGGTWTPQDLMVLDVPQYGLASVPATGGVLQKVAIATKEPIYAQGITWLAGGDWVAFTDYLAARRSIRAVNLRSGELRELLSNAQGASYAAGNLVYYQGGGLWAVPFDPDKLATLGTPTQLEFGVNEENYVAQATASRTGVLAYAPGPAGNFFRNLYLVNRKGLEQKLDVPPQDYVDPAMSPDGKRIAMAIRTATTGQQIVVLNRDRGLVTTLVPNGSSTAPVWTSDGKYVVFNARDSSQQAGIYRVAADGRSEPQLLKPATPTSHVTSIVGETAAVVQNDPVTNTDLWFLSLRNPYEMRPFKHTPAAERQGSLSPDGHWLAYASNDSGRSEIYVEPVPGPGGRRQVSSDGGEQPRWVRNGREIVYRNGTKMMSVLVQLPVFQAGKPLELFDRKFDRGGAVAGYDVSPDGQTFVMTRSERDNPKEIRVVIGWPPAK
jgi:Tol biopolymer transport system component